MRFWLVLTALLTRVTSLTFNLETGAYEDLVVGISDQTLSSEATLEDKQKLIQDAQVLVQEMSRSLFEVTEGQVHVGSAVILVPRSWELPDVPDLQLGFDKAEIRIDIANPTHGVIPYTHQPMQCGIQGRYIHVTSEFVTQEEDIITRTGPIGRVMIHEWSQFRWGVREEYGYPDDTKYPYFYQDPQGSWVPTGSNTSKIQGQLRTVSGGECTFSEEGEPSLDCRFYPELDASASIMHFHHLESKAEFSTENDNNRLSPSKQANVCDLKSSWEIISSHPDLLNIPGSPPSTVPDVRVTVAQPDLASAAALYVVIDLTTKYISSDLTVEIFETYRSGLKSFFTDLSDGARVSLITYQGVNTTSEESYQFKVLAPLAEMSQQRELLLQLVDTLQPVSDSIGRDSYQPMVDVAEIAKTESGGERGITFFTQNGRGTKSELNAIPDLQDANLGMVGVGFVETANAPNQFTVCTNTGGRSFILQRPFTTGFKQAIEFAALGDDPRTRLYQVSSGSEVIQPNSSFTIPVYLEIALGRDTIIAVTSLISLKPMLMNPEGLEMDPATLPECENVVNLLQYVCNFPDAMSGEWGIIFTCDEGCKSVGEKASWSVTSYLRDNPDITWPTLTAWTSGTAGLVDLVKEDVLVYVELRAQYRPLVGSQVILNVEQSQTNSKYMLRDDGKEPDIVAGDGVYVTRVQPMSDNPMSLSVSVTSSGNRGPAFISSQNPGLSWGILPVDQESFCCGSVYESSHEPYRMERSIDLPVILRVQNYDSNYRVKPQIIEDLEIAEVQEEMGVALVSMTWTAPYSRDGTENDKVSSYELYFATNESTILDDIESAILVTSDLVTSPGGMDPLNPGELHEVTFELEIEDGYEGSLFFRIQSLNSYGDKSILSRAVYTSVNITEAPPTEEPEATTTTTEEPEDTTTTFIDPETTTASEDPETTTEDPIKDPPEDPGVQVWFIALMSVLGVTLVAACVAAAFLIWRKRRLSAPNSTTELFDVGHEIAESTEL